MILKIYLWLNVTILFLGLRSNLFAQSFLNPTLIGSQIGDTVNYWNKVPYTDPVCMANSIYSATPDVTNTNQFIYQGTPYAGFTFVSGLHSKGYMSTLNDTLIYQEGIMQTVSGFIPGNNYEVTFYQSVIKQVNCLDKSGSWVVYVDTVVAGISTPSYSNLPPNSLNNVWDYRNVYFQATDTSHLIKILPLDDDLNIYGSTTDTTGGLRMGIDYIHINPGPPCTPQKPNLGSDTYLCSGDSIILNASVNNATYTWLDGSTDSIYVATQAGVYWVTTTDACGTASDLIIIENNYWPDLGNDTILCDGQTIVLDAGTPGANYLWQDSSGDTTFLVDQAGLYYVTVSNLCGSVSDSINISYNPVPQVYLGSDTLICSGDSILLDVTKPNATYVWDYFGSSYDSILVVSSPGMAIVNVTVNGCTGIDTIVISNEAVPDLVVPSIQVCKGDSALLTLNPPNQQDYTVLWGTGSTSDTIVVLGEGYYTIEATSQLGCIYLDSVQVIYETIPDVIPQSTVLCPNDSVLISTQGITTQDYYFNWSTGDTNSYISVQNVGEYTLQLTSQTGCIFYDTTQVINDLYAGVNLPSDSLICMGDEITISIYDNEIWSYLWNDSIITYDININQPGPYWVEVTSIWGCMYYDTINVLVETIDTSVFFSDEITLNAVQFGTQYQWYDCLNDSTIPGETSQDFVASTNGTYAVILTGTVCVDTSACYTISTIGLTESTNNQLLIYPNPATDVLTISNDTNEELYFTLEDLQGRIVESGFVGREMKLILDVSNYASGQYLIKFNSETFILKKYE